jgi:hypothetical protein
MSENLTSGVSFPTMRAMSGYDPRASALHNQTQSNNYQNNLNKIGGKKRKIKRKIKRKTYKGGFFYPQNKSIYPEVGGSEQSSAHITNNLATIQAQNYANRSFDTYATQQGGKRSKKRRSRSKKSRSKSKKSTKSRK